MKKEDISPIKSIFIGSTAAMAEASVNHPLWSLKLRQQAKKPFTLDPRIYTAYINSHSHNFITDARQLSG